MGVKKVENIVESQWQSEGRGARVRRSIGRPELKNLDPFLMLDEFSGNSKDGAGFPDHPHRGSSTIIVNFYLLRYKNSDNVFAQRFVYVNTINCLSE